ncbi:MAG: hypothetical protein IJ977_10055, partial [Fibrobacter sp.]|nr:hypothetical protein [Fibrobacter sp.]
ICFILYGFAGGLTLEKTEKKEGFLGFCRFQQAFVKKRAADFHQGKCQRHNDSFRTRKVEKRKLTMWGC